jgi:16S rRNA (cytosine1402-N4)-methyltransferase
MGYGFHEPVLGAEVVDVLIGDRNGIYVDCTLGGGGHSLLILQQLSPAGFLVGLDADQEAIEYASRVLADFPNKHLRQIYYDQIDVVLYEIDKLPVDGILFDLGISSWQIDVGSRGFSYQNAGPLDMRMDQRQEISAETVLNSYPREELERIFREYGEERHWRAIAREVVNFRAKQKLTTTDDLVGIVRSVVGERFLNKSLSRIFQAVRIEVNQELERLQTALEKSFAVLKKGGRIAVISYHSLEDRIVKRFFKEKQQSCVCPPELPQCMCGKVSELKMVSRKPILPTAEEIRRNPRARSAKLRVAEKITEYQSI